MFIKSKLYIWLLIIGWFFLDIGWFSGPIYGDDLFANKIKILQKEMQQCGNDATCHERILCPIHGFSKVSRDESSGVYIGGRPVALAGGKTDCGAKILSGSTLKLLRTVKQ